MSFLTRSPSSSPPFPTYLLPSVPFRRRRKPPGCINDPSFDPFTAPHPETHLHGNESQLRCARCAADLCSSSQIISKGFTGRHGRAYLVSAAPCAGSVLVPTSSLPNTRTHKPVPRQLVTGAHTVSDVSCASCESVLGWKYDAAEEESQRYKVGKFILETKKIFTSSCWENDGACAAAAATATATGDGLLPVSVSVPPDGQSRERGGDHHLEFDSQDEDECEDLFAGVWSQALALKRRQGRRFGRVIAGMSSGRL